MMPSPDNEVGILEWIGGTLVALFSSVIGYLYIRLGVVSDRISEELSKLRDEQNQKHAENAIKHESLRSELTRQLETVAAASASRQEQILFQLAGKATREEVRESEQRIVRAIAQRLDDLGLSHK